MKQTHAYMASIRLFAHIPTVQRYGRGDILRLIEHIDALEAELKQADLKLKIATEDEERAVAAADRLTDNVVQLQRELTEARESKKVVLPKEIAEVMKKLEAVGHTVDEAAWVIAHGGRADATDAEETLNKYALRKNGFIQLVNALQYGYTIEEPIDHEQRLRIDIERLVTTWDRTRPTSSLVKDIDEALDDYFQETAK